MGIDLYCEAFCDENEQSVRDGITDFFQNIECIIPQPEPTVIHYQDGFEVTVFFAADPVFFNFDEGRLLVSAKTNNGGPGYHAYLVRLLKQLEQKTGIRWDPEHIEDESGYWESGDFLSVQSAMANWLHSMSVMLVEQCGTDGELSELALGMDPDCRPENNGHFAVYPLGRLEKDFFEGILRTDALERHCSKFFVWWNEGLDADFYLNYGLYIIWNHINWLAPADEQEAAHYANALRCLETVRRMNPQADLPAAEWYAMASLVEDEALMRMLRKEFPGIQELLPEMGHLRNKMTVRIGEEWTLKIPGQTHREMEDNTLVYWNDTLTIRIRNLRATNAENAPVPAEDFLRIVSDKYDCAPYTLPEHPNAKSKLLHALTEEEESGPKTYHDTTLFSAVDGSLLMLSGYYDNPKDKELVMDIVHSVKPLQLSEG